MTGFHKRKKKRRKEAQKILQEKERKKKIQDRKRVRNTSLPDTYTKAVKFLFCNVVVHERYLGSEF